MTDIAYRILLCLYIILIFVYVFSKRDHRDITPWPLLKELDKPKPPICQKDDDCPLDHLCMGQKCLPKMMRGGKCQNGEWISLEHKMGLFATCICPEPHIYKQNFLGGECDVLVACSGHGKFVGGVCQCDKGYSPGPNYTCFKRPIIEQITTCADDEMEVHKASEKDGFHADYLTKLRRDGVKCVKRPCTFDAETNLPLKHGRYDENWGCLCDPRYGLYGVNLRGSNEPYLRGEGHDACVHVYKKLDNVSVAMKMYTFYYLLNRPPVTFIVFNEEKVVGQKWPNNYMQYVLENEPFGTRIRFCQVLSIGVIAYCHENYHEYPYRMPNCSTVKLDRTRDYFTHSSGFTNWVTDVGLPRWLTTPHQEAYTSMYRWPVCFVDRNVKQADPMFWFRVIFQPNMLTYKGQEHLYRTNALQLYYNKSKEWFVDIEDGYDAHKYKNMKTNAPIL